jgi:hypothetical protein
VFFQQRLYDKSHLAWIVPFEILLMRIYFCGREGEILYREGHIRIIPKESEQSFERDDLIEI